MLSTAPNALAATAARLRSGVITADYAPAAIAELIEALAREKREAAAYIAQLEQASTPAAARNAYAAGWNDAKVTARHFLASHGRTDLEDELSTHMQPDFARAGQVAHEDAV